MTDDQTRWFRPNNAAIFLCLLTVVLVGVAAWEFLPKIAHAEGVWGVAAACFGGALFLAVPFSNLQFFRVAPDGLERWGLSGRVFISWSEIEGLEPWSSSELHEVPSGCTLRSVRRRIWILSQINDFDELVREIERRSETMTLLPRRTTHDYRDAAVISVRLSWIGVLLKSFYAVILPTLTIYLALAGMYLLAVATAFVTALGILSPIEVTFTPDEIRVRTLLGVRLYPTTAVTRVRYRQMLSTYGLELVVDVGRAKIRLGEQDFALDAKDLARKLASMYELPGHDA